MIGAIIGDIVGSRFEWNPIKTKEFDFLTSTNFFTDDSILTLAIGKALMEWEKDKQQDLSKLAIDWMQKLGRSYPNAGYGGMFYEWLVSPSPQPYNSLGNGAAMRVSPVAYFANSIDEVKQLAYKVTSITHNHAEGLKGAEATACAIFLALNHKSKEEIKKYIENNYYKLNFSLDSIRDEYSFDVTCQGTVPQAIVCFLESNSYEDCIRNCISLGGDSDTLAAIAGGIAEAYYGINNNLIENARKYLTRNLNKILDQWISRK